MVAIMPPSKKSKVAPSRHWSTMKGLLMHSQQLHHVMKAIEQQESREQCRRLLSTIDFQKPTAIATVHRRETIEPVAKPIVFRKTKREIQREREREHALMQQQNRLAIKPLEKQPGCQESGVIMRQLDNLRTTLLASCKRLTSAGTTITSHSQQRRRLSCRMNYLQRASSGLSRRCPPRRRLLF